MRSFEIRRFILLAIFLVTGFIFLCRLFYIQVVDESYKLTARNQALRFVTQFPVRGWIYDRNKDFLVFNEAAYDLMVIPRRVKALDTLGFCKLIGITKDQFDEKIAKASEYSRYKASVFEKQISAESYAVIVEKLYQFPGFFAQERTLRKYPRGIAAHVLGYVSETNAETLKKDRSYKRGEYIGAIGLEKYYEKALRGKPGIQILVVDVHNTVQGSYENGSRDTLAISGTNLISTIDAGLQAYGERLMENKKGSIVAIEPETGEILTMVSSPSYNPNLLVGRKRSRNYNALARNDSLDPLFNRAVMAKYSPGSIFKIVQALIALQEGVINENTSFPCNKNLLGCHNHPYATNIQKAIQYSCNPYFFNVFKRLIQQGKEKSIFKDSELGLVNWRKHILSFGFGKDLHMDFPDVKSGNIPDVDYYNKIYGKHRWAFSTIYSLGIGQGEIEVVPVQMANLVAIIANRGWYCTPHLIKSIGGEDNKPKRFKKRFYTTVKKKYFETVAIAMQKVVSSPGGTARRAKIDSISVCGKTGTVENPHGEDHSVFIAFAPKDNPEIAIAVYVENAGFGGTWAAPIASLMIEKYLSGTIRNKEKEARILAQDFITSQK